MKGQKLAVIVPGIGYHKDKPLLYYAGKLALARGYEVVSVDYRDMPQKIRGNSAMMEQAAGLAYEQTKERLQGLDLTEYDEVLFIGKSIGTVAAAKYVAEHDLQAGQVWYTPVEATFFFAGEDALRAAVGGEQTVNEEQDILAFIGDEDPWSDVTVVKELARERGIRLYSYPRCNHSLECDDVAENIAILRDVMDKTAGYMDGR